MKKIFFILTLFSFLVIGKTNAQSFDISNLDNALGLLNQGNQPKVATILETAVSGLQTEAKASTGQFAEKLLAQTSLLSGIIPALSKGNANLSNVAKIINTIKTVAAALRLANLASGGLKGKASQFLSNVNFLKTGLGMLNLGSSADKVISVLSKLGDKSAKLDKSGICANMAQKAMAKKLNSSLNILGGLL